MNIIPNIIQQYQNKKKVKIQNIMQVKHQLIERLRLTINFLDRIIFSFVWSSGLKCTLQDCFHTPYFIEYIYLVFSNENVIKNFVYVTLINSIFWWFHLLIDTYTFNIDTLQIFGANMEFSSRRFLFHRFASFFFWLMRFNVSLFYLDLFIHGHLIKFEHKLTTIYYKLKSYLYTMYL